MAKLAVLPAKEVIDALRGVIDFYAWCNLNIARKWPRIHVTQQSVLKQLRGQQFAYINQQASHLSADLIAYYEKLASQTAFTWKDWLNRLFINGDYHYLITGP